MDTETVPANRSAEFGLGPKTSGLRELPTKRCEAMA